MEKCLRVIMVKEDEMRLELDKLRRNKCGNSRMNLSYKHLNERQVMKKVQKHRLENKRFCPEYRKPPKRREVRIVNTSPRVRGFLSQDFLPILERIPKNCVYSPGLRNGINEGLASTKFDESGDGFHGVQQVKTIKVNESGGSYDSRQVRKVEIDESGNDFYDYQWIRDMISETLFMNL